MKNKYSEIRSSIKTKINSNDYQVCESDDEYLYAAGQLIRYFVSLSKIKDKAHSLANPVLTVNSWQRSLSIILKNIIITIKSVTREAINCIHWFQIMNMTKR